MNMQSLSYVVLLRACGREHFLLWKSGGAAPDRYVLQPGTSSFLRAATLEALLDGAVKLGCRVAEPTPEAVPHSMPTQRIESFSPLGPLRRIWLGKHQQDGGSSVAR